MSDEPDDRIRFGSRILGLDDEPPSDDKRQRNLDLLAKARAVTSALEKPGPFDRYVAAVNRFELEMRCEAAHRILSGATDGYSVCIEGVPNGVPEYVADALVAAAVAVADGTLPRTWMRSIRLDLGHNEVRVEIEP